MKKINEFGWFMIIMVSLMIIAFILYLIGVYTGSVIIFAIVSLICFIIVASIFCD